MSNEYRHVELLMGDVRRRRWTTEQKLTIIEQSFEPGETVSSAARRHGVAPNLLYRWRRLLSEGGAAAVDSDEPVVGNSKLRYGQTDLQLALTAHGDQLWARKRTRLSLEVRQRTRSGRLLPKG